MLRSCLVVIAFIAQSSAAELSVTAYPSIQEALNANPNRMLFVPAGDYKIDDKIRIRGDRAGLFGPGRIIQTKRDRPIIEIENATNAEVRDLTLVRPDGAMDTHNEAILAIKCRDLVIDNVRVIDNRSNAGTIAIRESKDTRISHCLVRNYMRVSVDDRTKPDDTGYAFNCTDGTGISVAYSTGTLIEGNRIIEEVFFPTPEVRDQYKLGKFVKKNRNRGLMISQQAWDEEYTSNWRQGSGIVVTAPEVSDFTRIIGNHIENAAQGIDIHSDHVIISNNVVHNSHMGMKAMHGSRNVIITGNQFSKNDLWAIGLMPGMASHAAEGDKADNSDGGSVIANNIISGFGHGSAHWMWGNERSPFKFDCGQEESDPPLTDVLIQGNVVNNVGPPVYIFDVIISTERGSNTPRGLHFANNLFPPGTRGVCNLEMQP
ncbi:MAG: right-handed parallel beta-helix repeat-containing protein [Verrucomicrobiaceae bacterium]|nr:right-handed parallel beta-helix repeat-containing protein [Verrucomicrobiaceae bacterium]